MKALREVFTGLVTALASSVIVLGAIMLALTEGLVVVVPTPGPTFTLLPVFENTVAPGTPTATRLPTLTSLPVIRVTATIIASICPRPAGWESYTVLAGDTLTVLAADRGVTLQTLISANCLVGATLPPGSTIYLPVLPTPVFTLTITSSVTPPRCGPPRSWVRYLVQPGDTLTQLHFDFNVTVTELMQANCLTSALIRAGQYLWVPNIATRTPTFTNTAPPPADTNTPLPTRTNTRTTTPTPTGTPFATGTFTVTPTPTMTATRTPTGTSTQTTTPTTTQTP